jgi:GH15 family glucan-1,4-alpha-glucosidase
MTYTVSADTTGMACTVTATAKSGKYQLITSYLTDPARASVVAHTQYKPLAAGADTYQLHVRLDASSGNGGGGTANGGGDTAVIDTSTGVSVPVSYDTNTTTNATSYIALRGDQPFPVVSSGFVGTSSDGLAELDGSHALTPTYPTASNGNVEQTAKVQRDGSGSFTLALGFGATQADAVNTAAATAATPIGTMTSQYQSAWQGYDAGLWAPSATLPGLTAAQRQAAVTSYYQSANVVKASEDKTFPGAIIAGLDVPWGQAVSADDPNTLFTPGYREVFGRDLYEAWTALYTA